MQDEFLNLTGLRHPEDASLSVITVQTETGLQLLHENVATSKLLPGEELSLLPGPDQGTSSMWLAATDLWSRLGWRPNDHSRDPSRGPEDTGPPRKQVRHHSSHHTWAPGSGVWGSIPFRTATVEFGNHGEVVRATAELELTAIDTGNPRRDRDLAKPHLLNTHRNPILATPWTRAARA